jgi:hypothetical protein
MVFDSFTMPTWNLPTSMPRTFKSSAHADAVLVSMPVARSSAMVFFARSSVDDTADRR